jgi:hypothetical protein
MERLGFGGKTCILDAGKWESDILTEDLDLSYRAQLKTGNLNTLNMCPAELPAIISAARSNNSVGIRRPKL